MKFEDLRNNIYPRSRKRTLDFVRRTKHPGSTRRSTRAKRRAKAKYAKQSRKRNRLGR